MLWRLPSLMAWYVKTGYSTGSQLNKMCSYRDALKKLLLRGFLLLWNNFMMTLYTSAYKVAMWTMKIDKCVILLLISHDVFWLYRTQSARTDCNHVFLNFASTLTITDPMNPSQLIDTVRDMVMRYGVRLWKLRILQAELKMNVKYVSKIWWRCSF